jgi:CubicO group peptidase (beta-lactamase class C family)
MPLTRSNPESQGISSRAIQQFVERSEKEIDALHSFMLLRHGQVVAEGWWAPYAAATPHQLYSLSKSFTSSAVGLAIAEGLLSLDDTVISFFDKELLPAEPSANLQAMRIRDLLAMNSGHQDDTLGRFFAGGDGQWSRAFLNLEVEHKPGTHFVYNTGATYMLAAILQKVTGEKLIDYLRPRLFDKLGIKNPRWQESPEGINVGGWGLDITTEDIARFGQLYLQKGQWNGEQILSEQWVEMASARQTSNGSNPDSDWEQGYGYQFWRCRYDIYRGDGAFGQYCIVMPEQDAVLAITSGVKDMQVVLDLVWETLLPAMQDAPLKADGKKHAELQQKLKALQLPPQAGERSSKRAKSANGKHYIFPANEDNIESVSFAWGKETIHAIRVEGQDHRIPVGYNTWVTSDQGEMGLVAASGAWVAEDTYTLKIYYYETPYSTSVRYRFDGEKLIRDEEQHVSFGPTQRPQLVGEKK